MTKIISKHLLKERVIQLAFFILICFILSANLFSREHWNHDYMKVGYDADYNCVVIRFEFIDYDFGPANETGYLEYCDFLYSTDGDNFIYLMRSETSDQKFETWSWINMKNKIPGAKLQFNNCYSPVDGTMWLDNVRSQRVEVHNFYEARLTIKWFMDETYKDIKKIMIVGKWYVNGIYSNEFIYGEVYDATLPTFPGDVIETELNNSPSIVKTEARTK